jgi:hypothetical protein
MLQAGIAESAVRLPEEARGFSLFHVVQTSRGAHPNSYPMGTWGGGGGG